MTPTLERDIVTYLRAQADRIEVTSTLDAIENDLVYLPRARHSRGPRRLAPLLAAASVAALAVGLAFVARGSDAPASTASDTASNTIGNTLAPIESEPLLTDSAPASTTPPAPDTIGNTPAPVRPDPSVIDPTPVPLPDGAVLNGMEPICTATIDEMVFKCTIPAFPEPVGTLDYTGYVTEIVDDASRVSGGCRSTNPVATEYLCYIGQRAIDEQIISEDFLGDQSSREYASG
ncbi:MAG TPA: hypothetical protein VES40_22055 [Ilumatobacteraceae bacterium]|nr:hypothetical protein [Ilumatobacteraceae bacterium]